MKVKFQFVTDVEGDLNFFKKQIRQSEILRFSDKKETHLEFKTDNLNELFVFGGDICDRGEDITLIQMLVELKQNNPERVILIVGNRDANKTRFSTELPLNPQEHLNDDIERVVKPEMASMSYKDYLGIEANTPINRLKWILQCTMSAPAAFECRRRELMHLKDQAQVSDEEVYISFRQSVEAGGFMRQYLSLAQIGAVIGDTLIIHGGINSKNMGKVPNGFNLFEKKDDIDMITFVEVQSWITHLNKWYQAAIERWVHSQPSLDTYQFSNAVPASPLQHMAFSRGSYFEGQLPVVSSFLDGGITPWPVTEDVSIFLQKSGINRVVAGHQPNSGMPLMLLGTLSTPLDDRSVQVFTCDTLYGNRDAYHPDTGARVRALDPRGSSCAAVHVLCDQQNRSSCTSIKGVDGFGIPYERTVCFPRAPDEDPYIGRVLKIDEKFYTVRINVRETEMQSYVLTHTAKDFSITYLYKSAEELSEFEARNYFLTENKFSTAKTLNL